MFKKPWLLALLSLLLGTGAEAHSIFINGRWVKHSIGCIGLLKGVSDPTKLLQFVECAVTPTSIEVLCPNLQVVLVEEPPITLMASKQIEPGDIINKRRMRARVEVLVSEESLLKNPEFCAKSGALPIAAIIREMNSQMRVSQCIGEDPNNPCPTTSTMDVERCVLRRVNFDDDFDDDGARYNCPDPDIKLVPHHVPP